MCTISTQTKYQNQEPTGTIMKRSLQCLVPNIPGALGFLLPKATQEGPLLCGVALKNRCGESKPATTIAALTAWKYNSRNPEEQTPGCPTDSTLLTFLGNGWALCSVWSTLYLGLFSSTFHFPENPSPRPCSPFPTWQLVTWEMNCCTRENDH